MFWYLFYEFCKCSQRYGMFYNFLTFFYDFQYFLLFYCIFHNILLFSPCIPTISLSLSLLYPLSLGPSFFGWAPVEGGLCLVLAHLSHPRSLPLRGGLRNGRHLFVPAGTRPSSWNGHWPAGHCSLIRRLFVRSGACPPGRRLISPSLRRGDLPPEECFDFSDFSNSQPNLILCVLDLGFRDFQRFLDEQNQQTKRTALTQPPT